MIMIREYIGQRGGHVAQKTIDDAFSHGIVEFTRKNNAKID